MPCGLMSIMATMVAPKTRSRKLFSSLNAVCRPMSRKVARRTPLMLPAPPKMTHANSMADSAKLNEPVETVVIFVANRVPAIPAQKAAKVKAIIL